MINYDIINMLGTVEKLLGVLQFGIRFSKTILCRIFDDDGVSMRVLKPVNRPLVLIYLHIYLLATYNSVDINDCREWGHFSFGGRYSYTSINQIMYPYMEALIIRNIDYMEARL